MKPDRLGRCFCPAGGPLCSFCIDATLTPKLRRVAERIGDAWGRDVYRRRPDGTWPHWDHDTTGNLQRTALGLVAHLHTDPGILDRLARTCAYHAGLGYSDERKRAASSP